MSASVLPHLPDFMDVLLKRRSVTVKDMKGPGPDKEELGQILEAGWRVPDHGKLGPWRFVVFEGDARAAFGKVLAEIFAKQEPKADKKRVSIEAERFTRAPVVVAVISTAADHPKIPKWEQRMSAGAACQNMLVAAAALGLAAQWLTEWYAFDKDVHKALGMKKGERVAGFIYIGSAEEKPEERARPPLEERVSYWKA